jgi:hypothetical protein
MHDRDAGMITPVLLAERPHASAVVRKLEPEVSFASPRVNGEAKC